MAKCSLYQLLSSCVLSLLFSHFRQATSPFSYTFQAFNPSQKHPQTISHTQPRIGPQNLSQTPRNPRRRSHKRARHFSEPKADFGATPKPNPRYLTLLSFPKISDPISFISPLKRLALAPYRFEFKGWVQGNQLLGSRSLKDVSKPSRTCKVQAQQWSSLDLTTRSQDRG